MSIGYKLFSWLPFSFLKRRALNYLKSKKAGSVSPLLREIFKKDFNITVGYGTYGGCFNPSNIPPGVTFGNYCSIADGVKIFRANHPMNTFTTHPIFYNPIMGHVEKDLLVRPILEIGNDVWIGANVIILPSVRKIGNGAIIGAGSVVTKDVEPYSVVAGNPAKFIKNRFKDSIIDSLEKSKWWELNYSDLYDKYADNKLI